jgi:hypothetical protein
MKFGKTKEAPDAEAAKAALARDWGTRGDDGMSEVVDALRPLTKEQLGMLKHWVPNPPPGTSTAAKCEKARGIIVDIAESK